MGVLKKFFNQTRKPEGRLGRIMLRAMNAGHARMADWGMSHLRQISPENILELGCGAGRNAGELLKRYPQAHVTAVDYSSLFVEKAKEYNKAMVRAGHCKVLQGDVSALPFSDGSFDLATAFETVYFWPGLEKCFSEVYRVLKPGGCFLISNESDGRDAASQKFRKDHRRVKTYTAKELEAALRTVGFSEVTSDHHRSKPWITVIAIKREKGREKTMHTYYAENKDKLKKDMKKMLSLIRTELEDAGGKKYGDVFEEIWAYYEAELLERFPYIGGKRISGTRNLTGAYSFVAMGEVLQKYGVDLEETGRLMVMSYERMTMKMPWILRKSIGKLCKNTRLLNRIFMKKDAKNAVNAAENPGSFETKTQIPPEEGYDFSYHNLVCPLADFAKQYGYEAYMPYLCNLDYVMFGVLGVPLFREHTCFEDGDFCDFKIKIGEKPMEYWPPVFTQGRGYK